MARDPRRERRGSRTGLRKLAIVILAGVLIVWAGWSLKPRPVDKPASTVKLDGKGGAKKASEKKAGESVVAQRTFLILSVVEGEDLETIDAALLLVCDPARNRVGGLKIESDTYVVIPGRGYEAVSEGLREETGRLQDAIEDLVGVEVEGYLTIASETFDELFAAEDMAGMFNENLKTNLKKDQIKTAISGLTRIPKDRGEFVELPVRPIVIGEQTYYEPQTDDLADAVRAVWGRAPKKTEEPVRLIILNGNGEPGVARVAADRLVGKGFRILDIKNATDFDYDQTEIVIYNKNAEDSGKKIKKALGRGVIRNKNVAQDVTDIVVVVGKDFN